MSDIPVQFMDKRRLLAAVLFLAITSVALAVDFYVDAENGHDIRDGLSWATAKATISSAIEASAESAGTMNRIRVAEGTYGCFLPHSRLIVEGGYPAGGGVRELGRFETVIRSSSSECTTMFFARSVTLDGLSFVGHHADWDHDVGSVVSAPIRIDGGTNIRLSNLQLRGNSAVARYACERYYDQANQPYCRRVSSLSPRSAGISVVDSEIDFTNILLVGNRFKGEEISSSSGCFPGEDGCEAAGATPNALALDISGSSGEIRNVTIADNDDCSTQGGTPAVRVFQSPNLVLENVIVYGNEASEDVYFDGMLSLSHSDIGTTRTEQGEVVGSANFSEDPLFVPGPLGDYYLGQGFPWEPGLSPCVDAGSDTAAAVGLDAMTTNSGEAYDDSTVDIGFHYPVPAQIRARVIRLARDVTGTRVLWAPAASGEYDLIRGRVSELTRQTGTVDLGFVDCVGSRLQGGGIRDDLSPSSPPAGEAFFYLLRDRNLSDAYGSSSRGEQRIGSQGNLCP